MNVGGLIAGVCLAALAALVLWRSSRAQARRIRWRGGEDQVHELRVLLGRMSRISVVCGAAAAFLCVGWVRWPGISPGAAAVVVVLAAACLALPPAAARRPVVSTYARLRGIPVRALRSYRRLAAAAIMTAVMLWPLAVVLAVRMSLAVGFLILLVGCLVANPVLTGLLAPALAWLLGPAALPAEVGARLSRLSAELGVRVHGRLAQARERKVANAMQVGWLPRLRYVLVSDYLLDMLTPAEVDACLAHELAHARHHDYVVRALLRGLVLFVPCLLLAWAVAARPSGPLFLLAVLVTAGVVLFGLRPLSGAVLIREELAADDVAVTVAGAAVLVAALNRLTELNAIKRETSLAYDQDVGHPGMARRLARLGEVLTGEPPATSQEAGMADRAGREHPVRRRISGRRRPSD